MDFIFKRHKLEHSWPLVKVQYIKQEPWRLSLSKPHLMEEQMKGIEEFWIANFRPLVKDLGMANRFEISIPEMYANFHDYYYFYHFFGL